MWTELQFAKFHFMPEHRLLNCKQRVSLKLWVDFKRATLETAKKLEEYRKTRLQDWQEKT